MAAATTGRGDALFVPFALLVELAAGVLLLLALARGRGAGIAWALVLSVLAYLLAVLAASPEVDPTALVVGVFLFLAAELAYWSVELRPPARQAPDLPVRRLTTIVTVALAAELLAAVALLGTGPGSDASVLLDVAGAVAAVAAVALLVKLRPG